MAARTTVDTEGGIMAFVVISNVTSHGFKAHTTRVTTENTVNKGIS
jgi:hypothetical protein